MIVSDEIRHWANDEAARAASLAQAEAARQNWIRQPFIARLAARLDAAGGDADEVASIAASVMQDDVFSHSLCADTLRTIGEHPFFPPPFPAASGAIGESLKLFDHRDLTVSLVLVHADGLGAKASRPGGEARSVAFSGVLTFRRILKAGGGVIQRYAAAPVDECLSLATHPPATKGEAEALDEDRLLVVDGRRESIAFIYAHSAILYLECEVLAGRAPYRVEYDGSDLRPVGAATTDRCASRCQLMLSALTALGGGADRNTYQRLLTNKSFELRWHTVREMMAVDPEGAWDCLGALAANDRHPEIRFAARQMLATRDGGAGACLA